VPADAALAAPGRVPVTVVHVLPLLETGSCAETVLFLAIWPMSVLSWATQRLPFDACSDSMAAPHRDGARPGSPLIDVAVAAR
jgi:hypothetical protein